MRLYHAYNLNLRSAIELPELNEGRGPADVTIRLGAPGYIPTGCDAVPYKFWSEDGVVRLWWEGVGAFMLRNGSEIVVHPFPGVEEGRLRLYLLGAVMGALLYQRGFFVLHASAIEVNGCAALFLGGKGFGKSTMAAYLHARGHRLLSDDVVALRLADDAAEFQAMPAFPQLKLWPDAIESLGGAPEAHPKLYTLYEKRQQSVDCGFSNDSVPLKQIYTLARGAEVSIEPVRSAEAMTCLIANLYAARFGGEVFRSKERQHFAQCVQIVKCVPVYRLGRPSDLALMPEIAEMVESHILGVDDAALRQAQVRAV